MTTNLQLLVSLFIILLDVYFYMIIAYIFMGWVQELRESRIYYLLEQAVGPFMRIFRGWVVIGNLDFTPMLGLMLYQFVVNFLIANI